MRATHTTTVRRTDSDTMHYGHTGYEAALGYAQHLVDTWDRSRGRITVDIWRIDSDTWVETLGKGERMMYAWSPTLQCMREGDSV